MTNFNIYFQVRAWKQIQTFVECDCYRTIYTTFKTKFQFLFMPILGTMAIAPYGFSLNQNHYNLIHSSQKVQGQNS